jgi:excinuclease UvrABC nuclease subunit
MVRSALLNLPGVGPAILRKILRVFKSTAKVKQKTPEELQKMTGIPFKTAKIIIKALNNEK